MTTSTVRIQHLLTQRISVPATVFVFVCLAAVSAFLSETSVLAVLLCLFCAAIVAIVAYPRIALLLYAALAFFHGWEINFSTISYTKHIALLSQLNAPVGHFVAGLCLIALLFGWLLRTAPKPLSSLREIPAGAVYVAFLFVALASVFQYGGVAFSYAFWYFVRFYVGAFVLFLVVPYLYIMDKQVLLQIFVLLFGVGTVAALVGILGSLRAFAAGWFPRAVPTEVFDVALFGYNHNLLAEPLVAIIPIGMFLVYRAYRAGHALFPLALACLVLMVAVTLLTFSRAAWTVLVGYFVGALLLYPHNIRARVSQFSRMFPSFTVLCVGFFACAIVAMSVFLTSSIVSESNMARVATTDISLYYALRQPFVGYAPGGFIPLLASVSVYRSDFGDPLDAHGVLQKLLVEVGILGTAVFVLYILLFGRQLVLLVRQTAGDPLALVAIALAGGAIVFQLFNTSYFNANMWFPLGLASAIFALLAKESKDVV